MKEWLTRHPDTFPKSIQWMMEDLEKLDAKKRAQKALVDTEKMDEDEDEEDVEMEKNDALRPPNPSPAAIYSQPINLRTQHALGAKFADPLHDVQQHAEELEDHITHLGTKIDETKKDLRKRISHLEDGLVRTQEEMAEIEGRTTALEGEEGKPTTTGWRQVRRGKGWIGHRHWTRYTEAQGEETIRLTTKEYGEIEKRMKRIEERMDRQRREAGEAKEEFVKVKALAARVNALIEAFNNFRANQERTNQAVSQEIADLRTRVYGNVMPKVETHAKGIDDLNARYASLYNLAGLFAQQAAPGRFTVHPNVQYAPTNFLPPGAAHYPHAPPQPANNPAPRQLPPVRKAIAI